MNKTFFVILFTVFAIVVAKNPSWYPKDFVAISEKCREESKLASNEEVVDLQNKEGIDKSKVYADFLCKAKNVNIYSEETGFYLDRLQFFFQSRSELKCDAPFVKECVYKNKLIVSHGERVFKVINCITEKEREFLKKGCGNRA